MPHPDARPGVHNPPGTPSRRYHDDATPPPRQVTDGPLDTSRDPGDPSERG